jgi:nucleotide-binding universal stress UspA family protein
MEIPAWMAGLRKVVRSEMKKVLVPLDGSEASEKALAFLHQVCAKNDAIVLFSVEKPKYPVKTGDSPGRQIPATEPFGLVTPEVPVLSESEEKSFASQIGETKDYVERLAAPLREAGFNVSTVVWLDDHADEAIIRFARDFQPTFIALSRSTRLQPSERLFGSVTTRVVESNVAPILVVPSVT